MSLSVGLLRGAEQRGQIDHRLARRHVINEYRRGRLGRDQVCDAHPELIRAASNVGTPSEQDCPICEESSLRLVTYVFGRDLRRRSGTPVWTREELNDLASDHDSFTAYTVECCLVCGWNHLHESVLMGQAHQR